MLFTFDNINAWEVAVELDEFKGSTAASGDVGEFLGIAEDFSSGGTVATTDNGERTVLFGRRDASFADAFGTFLEGWVFEDTHWAIPEDGLSRLDDAGIEGDGLWTDIRAFIAFWEVGFVAIDEFDIFWSSGKVIEVEAFDDFGIDGENDLASLIALLGVFELVIFTDGIRDVDAEDSLLEGGGHTTADEDLVALL